MNHTVKIDFHGDLDRLEKGLDLLRDELRFERGEGGLRVDVAAHSDAVLHISKKGNAARIGYRDPAHFFRGLGLLLEKLPEGRDFDLQEPVKFDTNGAMFDVSQSNSVICVAHVEMLLRKMAMMGLNMFMLYTEDSYDVGGWDYFGYMRGRYTRQDLKELDDYAYALGIELIPCIQTLAHLYDALRWPCFNGMRDDADTLLVGNERVYRLIEDMIRSVSEPLRTKRIHIGMDEAWFLGQGVYLLKNGLRGKPAIMKEHLERVLGITGKLGLKPMIWSDMFFRAASKKGDYYDPSLELTPAVLQSCPPGVQLVYWDYYHDDEAFYRDWIRRHQQFGRPPVFAGAAWTWTSFAPNWGKTFATTSAAMSACKKENVREVFVTVWGGESSECAIDVNLLGMLLFAEHGFASELDMKKFAERFHFLTGAELDEFMELSALDEVPGTEPGNPRNFNASKILMWQDILCGLFDKDIEGLPLDRHYAELCSRFAEYRRKPSELSEVYGFYEKVASVLSIKAELGIKIKAAYDRGDVDALRTIAQQVLPELLRRVTALKNTHRELWMKTNKPLGWETFDLRYGCLMNRIDTAEVRLSQYCSGEADKIGELEEPRRYFKGQKELAECDRYASIAMAGRFTAYNAPFPIE